MDNSHKEAIAAEILRFFRAYPQSSGLDTETISDYAKEVSMYAPTFVSRVVDHIIHGDGPAENVDRKFIPPIPVFMGVLRNTKIEPDEFDYGRRMRGLPPQKILPPPVEITFDPKNRAKSTTEEVMKRFRDDPGMMERVLENTPLGRRLQRMRTENAHRNILAKGISLDNFRSGTWPIGASYVMALETVYGPAERS